jgi:catechol 2,3-dioxygenase-like lactoylglutathione lyase family enzyme
MRVHISLPVRNLDKSRAFYSGLFGAPATKVKDDYLNFRLDEPAIHLALVQSDTGVPNSSQHYGVELPDAETFATWEKRAGGVESAIAVDPEPEAKCCYARANKVWLTDPDGHRWEIWHRTGEYESLVEPETELEPKVECCAC